MRKVVVICCPILEKSSESVIQNEMSAFPFTCYIRKTGIVLELGALYARQRKSKGMLVLLMIFQNRHVMYHPQSNVHTLHVRAFRL
jgi:hypothetical protein